MSCFCRAELNSGIKLDKSTAEARRLNQTYELKFDKLCHASRLWHGSDSNIVLMPCQTKFINYFNVFGGIAFAQGVTRRPRGEFSFTDSLNVAGSDTEVWRLGEDINV